MTLIEKLKTSSARKVLILTGLTLLVATTSYVTFKKYVVETYTPERIIITNVTDRSATVTWITQEKTPGVAIVSEEPKRATFMSRFTKSENLHFDDRDYAEAELNAAYERSQKARENSEDLDYGKISVEIDTDKIGSYNTHHVTIRNLEPSKSYYVQIGDTKNYLSTDGDGNDIAFTTYADREELLAPHPAYGKVTKPLDSLSNQIPIEDGIIYLNFNDKDKSEAKSNVISAPLNDGAWYIDLTSFYTLGADPYLGEHTIAEIMKNDQITALLEQGYTESPPFKQIFETDKYAPAPNIVVVPPISAFSNKSVSSGKFDNSLLVSRVSANNWCITCDGQETCADPGAIGTFNAVHGEANAQAAWTAAAQGYCEVDQVPGIHEGTSTAGLECPGEPYMETSSYGSEDGCQYECVSMGVTDEFGGCHPNWGPGSVCTKTDPMCGTSCTSGTQCIEGQYCPDGNHQCCSTGCVTPGQETGTGGGVAATTPPATPEVPEPSPIDTPITGMMFCATQSTMVTIENVPHHLCSSRKGMCKADRSLECQTNTIGTVVNRSCCLNPMSGDRYTPTLAVGCTAGHTDLGLIESSLTNQGQYQRCEDVVHAHINYTPDRTYQSYFPLGQAPATPTLTAPPTQETVQTFCNGVLPGYPTSIPQNICSSGVGICTDNQNNYECIEKATGFSQINESTRLCEGENGCWCARAPGFSVTISKGEYCPERNQTCSWIGTDALREGVVCNTAGYKCTLSRECSIPPESSSTNENPKVQKFSSRFSASASDEIILSPEDGLYIAKQDGLYCSQINDEEYCFNLEKDKQTLLFIDTNNNGVYEEGIDVIVNEQQNATIKLKLEETVNRYQIKEGLNFISFDFVGDFESATSLLDLLNNNYDDAFYSIAQFDSTWKIVGTNEDSYASVDFQIIPGKGYVLKSKKDIAIELSGKSVDQSIPVSLNAGWNLIAVHGSSEILTASSLLDDVNIMPEFKASNVTRWDTSRGRYDGIQKEYDESMESVQMYGFDYPINSQQGYFLKIDGAGGVYTPNGL